MTAINLCTESFDNEFERVKGLTWFPWIGKDYSSSKRRIMIVAESHYVNDKTIDENIQKKELVNNRFCTREVVSECVICSDWPNRMFDNLQCCLFGLSNKKDINSDLVWSNVVFWNLIQKPMNYNMKESPQKEDYLDGWKIFLDVIRILKPTDCLFVGVTASNYFAGSMREAGVNCSPVERIKVSKTYGRKYDLSTIGFKLPIIAIQHTSHHFNREIWHGFLTRFFNEPLRHLYDLTEDSLCCSGKKIRYNILKSLHKESLKLYYTEGENDTVFSEFDDFGWLQTWITLGRLRDDMLDALTIGCYGDGNLHVEIGIRKNPNNSLSDSNNKWWADCRHRIFSISKTTEDDVLNWLTQTEVYQSIFN